MKPTVLLHILTGLCILILTGVPSLLLAEEGDSNKIHVDPYLALFGGMALPSNTDRRVDDNTLNGHFTVLDAAYDSSKSLGSKIGVWFPGLRRSTGLDYGVELDVTNFQPDIKSGTRRASGSVNGLPVAMSTRASPTDVNSTIVAMNVLFRAPLYVSEEFPHGRVYPYVGGGVGFQNSSYGSDGRAPHDLALQALAGLHMFIVKRISLFAEYKFTHAQQTFTFGSQDQTINFNVSHVVAGLAIHLGR